MNMFGDNFRKTEHFKQIRPFSGKIEIPQRFDIKKSEIVQIFMWKFMKCSENDTNS